jgi:hypothetical protein
LDNISWFWADGVVPFAMKNIPGNGKAFHFFI